MKVHVVEQGTLAWHNLRLGIPTASEFDRILTPKTGKFAAAARGYAIQLVTERLLGRPVIDLSNIKAVAYGKDNEPAAVQMYEFAQDATTSPVGFITTDDGRIGASPDRLLDAQPGAVELKCPAPHTHIGYLLDGFGADYRCQVQGQMLVGGFEWIDRYSYHPELPPARERTHRDEPFIKLLSDALTQFLDLRDEILERALKAGATIALPQAPAAAAQRWDHFDTSGWTLTEDDAWTA